MKLGHARLKEALENGSIAITPPPSKIGPASIDVHLSAELAVYRQNLNAPFPTLLDIKVPTRLSEITIPDDGYILLPGILYLGATLEHTYTSVLYTPYLSGVSSVGRHGLSIHVTAGIGDPGYCGKWTLEMHVVQPLRIYPGMRIGQLEFVETDGAETYAGRYQNADGIIASRSHLDFKKEEK